MTASSEGGWDSTRDFAVWSFSRYGTGLLMSTSSVLAAVHATPEVAAVRTGFKDWSLVCAALGQGTQSLILRKGGIAEGRDGFRFKHESFFLFPTQFHQQSERIRPEALARLKTVAASAESMVEIRFYMKLEWAVWIDDWATVSRLQPFHVLREDVVRERFDYGDRRGLQCAFGRVFALEHTWTFPDQPSYGGCRSWLTLPEFPTPHAALTPVLDDSQHETVAAAVRAAVSPA